MSLIVIMRNISGLAPVSDYEVSVMVGDGGPHSRVISTGKVEGHVRDDGWQVLVQKYLDKFKDDDEGGG